MSYREQQENEEMRRQEEEEAETIRAENAYAEAMIRRDKLSPRYGAPDLAPDGRPLMLGTVPYEEWCAPKSQEKL